MSKNCQAEGRRARAKERSGERQHGSSRKWGDVQRACGRDRVGRPGDEKVGTKAGMPTLSYRKWGTRASFLARTDKTR